MAVAYKILTKIRKLVRLTESPEPHEAARAREEAARMMAKHGLTEDDLVESVIEVVEVDGDVHRQELARVIAVSRRCALLVRRGEIAFKGKPGAVSRAHKTYAELVTDVSLHCNIGPRDPGRHVWRMCFWAGFVEAVTRRLRAAEVPRAAPRVEPAPELPPAPREVAVERVPSLAAEADRALRDFASGFSPEDATRGIRELCLDAHRAGCSRGEIAHIEDYREGDAPGLGLPSGEGT